MGAGAGARGTEERRCVRCDRVLAVWRGSRLDLAADVGRERLEVLVGRLFIVCPDCQARVLIAAGGTPPGESHD